MQLYALPRLASISVSSAAVAGETAMSEFRAGFADAEVVDVRTIKFGMPGLAWASSRPAARTAE